MATNPSTEAFMCATCAQVYKTKENLRRHSKSHNSGAALACNFCGLAFHRKDLLARHTQIHRRDSCQGRLRNERACQPCRTAKIKCTGLSPCKRCESGRHACVYDLSPARLSQQHRISSSQAASLRMAVDHVGEAQGREASIANSPGVPDLTTPQSKSDGDAETLENPHTGTENSLAPSADENWTSDAVTTSDYLDNIDPTGFFQLTPAADSAMDFQFGSMAQPLSWPWRHEELFLLNGTYDFESFAMAMDLEKQIPINAVNFQTSQSNSEFTTVVAAPEYSPHTTSKNDDAILNVTKSGGSGQLVAENSNGTRNLVPDVGLNVDTSFDRYDRRDIDRSQLQEAIVDDLIKYAFVGSGETPALRKARWKEWAVRVQQAFALWTDFHQNQEHVLNNFIDLYMKYFQPLWPLFPGRHLPHDAIPPVLYLVLTSVGAMYAAGAMTYGSMMHERLRVAFFTAQFQFHNVGQSFEWLCQSLLTTQVASLYFGHRQAFSFAQQLGSIIVSFARKGNLFNDSFERYQTAKNSESASFTSKQDFPSWIRSETRKRLAFGILRVDIFVSVLLNTPPLISYEEINLGLPSSDSMWLRTGLNEEHMPIINRNRIEEQKIWFSDLMRIALDRGEILPRLSPAGYELVLLTLQSQIWRFSHDHELLGRITGCEDSNLSTSANFTDEDVFGYRTSESWSQATARAASTSKVDHLDCFGRKMYDLRSDCDRAVEALRKWKYSFSTWLTPTQLDAHRGVILSSRVLYHLSFVRLNTDIELLHLVADAEEDDTANIQEGLIGAFYRWSKSLKAETALRHCCAIWSLTWGETRRIEQERARFNILTFISVHLASMVIWAYAGTHHEPGVFSLSTGSPQGHQEKDLRIYQANVFTLLTEFEDLFRVLSKQELRQMSSFSATAAAMARKLPPPELPSRGYEI